MIHFLAYHNYMGPVNSLCEILTEGGFEIAEGTKLKLRCFLCFAHDYVANSVIFPIESVCSREQLTRIIFRRYAPSLILLSVSSSTSVTLNLIGEIF